MIKKICITNTATYSCEEFEPSKVNYIYGSNGTGKTTISKVISNPELYPECKNEWMSEALERCVYNKDFVKKHFAQSNSIKGIFTLGEDTKNAKKNIQERKDEIDILNQNIQGCTHKIEQLKKGHDSSIQEFSEKCWAVKKKYENYFRQAYQGFMASKKDFYQKCLKEQNNTSQTLTLEKIIKKKDVVFDNEIAKYNQIPLFEYSELLDFEKSKLLENPIIGKNNSQIGELIKRLNNSDWVNQGMHYLQTSQSKCPFCQQKIDKLIIEEIEGYFDETYAQKYTELVKYKNKYESYINLKISEVEQIVNTEIKLYDTIQLEKKLKSIKEIFKLNLLKIDNKIISPSISIELELLAGHFAEVTEIIEDYRKEIDINNILVDNLTSEKNNLKAEMWKYVIDELQKDVELSIKKTESYSKAKKGILKVVEGKTQQICKLEKEIKIIESTITSTEYTKNEINRILESFGYNGFRIENTLGKGEYKIVRPDGSDVYETLSEGEYTFITFLYFFQMIKGSINETGITRDKVVVIDDPISSLDSNILFIVSHLVKEIISDCLEGKNGVKQVFMLTHNVYFHKEVTFRGNRNNTTNNESFWVLKKTSNNSKIKKFEKNPIHTTYELLWKELDDLEKVNKATIFNTLRRILEYYFNIIGGINYEECIHEFEGEDKLVCKALISWINDGSHFVTDDLMVYVEPESIEKYLQIFEMIFEKMGHKNHYNMMRKIEE